MSDLEYFSAMTNTAEENVVVKIPLPQDTTILQNEQ